MNNKFLSMSFTAAVAFLAIPGTSRAGLYNIDTTFSNSGRFNWTTPGSDFRMLAHLALPGGRSIAITTYDNNGCPNGRHCFALYPYNASGQGEAVITLPTNLSFSKRTGGVVLDPYLVKAAAVDSQGRIVIAGTEQFGTVFQFKAIRLLPTGYVDTSFGVSGVATPGSFTAQNLDIAEAMAIDGSDRVIIAGSAKFASANDTDFAVMRLTSTGALDTNFSGDGKLTISFDLAGLGSDGATAVGIRTGGQIYLAGTADDAGVVRIGLVKVLPAGTLDVNFCPTTCNFQGPYTNINNGRRVLYLGDVADNQSDFVKSLAVNVSGEMIYAGLHQYPNLDFRLFTQKVSLTGEYLSEGLTNVGFTGPQTSTVGGIRYFDPNSGTSSLVFTGTTGPNGEYFFVQFLSNSMVPIPNWGNSGTNLSAFVYTAFGTPTGNQQNLPSIPTTDANARVLVGGSWPPSGGGNYSINVTRLAPVSPFDQIFANGF